MKLAEALSIRKDLQKRIQQLGQRIQNNVKVQEGDAPSEEPSELMKELDACLTQLEDLIWRINATNMKTTNAQGVTTITQLPDRAGLNHKASAFVGRTEPPPLIVARSRQHPFTMNSTAQAQHVVSRMHGLGRTAHYRPVDYKCRMPSSTTP